MSAHMQVLCAHIAHIAHTSCAQGTYVPHITHTACAHYAHTLWRPNLGQYLLKLRSISISYGALGAKLRFAAHASTTEAQYPQDIVAALLQHLRSKCAVFIVAQNLYATKWHVMPSHNYAQHN